MPEHGDSTDTIRFSNGNHSIRQATMGWNGRPFAGNPGFTTRHYSEDRGEAYMPNQLSAINHIVVLMLENRSCWGSCIQRAAMSRPLASLSRD
jgi:hypothetical protein